jgi:hypothetical protein
VFAYADRTHCRKNSDNHGWSSRQLGLSTLLLRLPKSTFSTLISKFEEQRLRGLFNVSQSMRLAAGILETLV